MTERFSASVAARHMACPASANLDVAIPNWQEPERVVGGAADTGTDHHKMFEQLFKMSPADHLHYAEMLTYVGNLRKGKRFKVMTEAKVKATWLQTQPSTTADLVLYTQSELHIMDPKTGKIEVPVTGNKQLMFYAACFAPLAPKAKEVTVHILQPWGGFGCSSWTFDTNELRQFMEDAQAAERKTMAKDTTFGPSDSCNFCPANPHGRGAKGKPLCPVMMDLLYPRTKVDVDAVLDLA